MVFIFLWSSNLYDFVLLSFFLISWFTSDFLLFKLPLRGKVVLLYIQVLHAFDFYKRKVFYIQTSSLFLFNCYFTLHTPMHLIIQLLRKKELLLFFRLRCHCIEGYFFGSIGTVYWLWSLLFWIIDYFNWRFFWGYFLLCSIVHWFQCWQLHF